jgi:hypothetical protein
MFAMELEEIRAFASRDWHLKEVSKQRHWAARHRAQGHEATLAASDLLRAHLVRLRPDWPSERDRAIDLRHHLELIAKLEGAAHAFVGR